MPFGEPVVDEYTRERFFRDQGVATGEEKEEPGFGAQLKAAFKVFNPVGAVYQAQKYRELYDPDEPVDTNYDPFGDPSLQGTIELFPEEFEQVKNQQHALRLKNRLDEEVESMETIAKGGITGLAAAGVAAVLDPINLIPVGGSATKVQSFRKTVKMLKLASKTDDVGRLAAAWGTRLTDVERLALKNRNLPSITLKNYEGASKLTINLDQVRNVASKRLAQSARGQLPSAGRVLAEGVVSAAIPALVSEAALAASRETYELEDFIYTGAAAGLLGGAIGAFRVRGLNRSTRELDSTISRVADEMANGSVHLRMSEGLTDSQIARMGPDAVEEHVSNRMKQAAPGTFDLLGENKLLRATIRDSPTGRLMADVGEGSDEVRALAAVLQDHPALTRETLGPSISAKIDAQTAKGLVEAENVSWFQRTAKASEVEFNERTVRAILGGSDEMAEVTKAAEAARRMFDDTLRRSKEAGLLDKGIQNYYPRFYMWDSIQANQEGFSRAIAPHVGGLEKAQKLTANMLVSKDRSFLDPANFTGTDKRGVFRERLLENVPTESLLEFIDTDVANVMRRYGRMANAQIEYAKLTPGDPTDGLNLRSAKARVASVMDERIKNAKSERTKQRLVKKKESHLSDIEYIRKIHLGEFSVDEFDNGMHAVMRPLRGVAAMVYLPWAGVSSVQDTLAVAWHNSAKTFWRSSSRWLRRQLKERIEKGELGFRDLFRMARAAEYAGSDMSRASLLTDFGSVTVEAGRRAGKRTQTIGGRVQGAADRYLTWNGLRPANVMARQVAIMGGADEILGAVQRRASGVPRQGDDILFAQAGITDELAGKIAGEMRAGHFVDDKGFLSPRLDDWNPDTADDFSAALFQNAKLSYVNPTAPVLPKWVKSEAGAMFFQFLSFPWASKNNYVINGYQRVMSGQIGRVGHGAMLISGFGISYELLRRAAAGEDLDRIDFDQVVTDGVDRTGVLGMLEITNEWLYAATGGAVGFGEFLGNKVQPSGLGDVAAFDAIGSLQRDVSNLTNWFTGERLSDQDKRQLGNRIPFVNIPWINQSIKGMADVLGLD